MAGVMGWFGKPFVGPFRKACAKDLVALRSHLESVLTP